MSKYTKLVNHPKIFFRDMLYNRLQDAVGYASKAIGKDFVIVNQSSQQIKKREVEKNPPKRESSTTKRNVSTSASLSIDTDHINKFLPLSVMLHCGEPLASGQAHLALWIPAFITSEVPFVVVVRNLELFKWVKSRFPWISAAYAKNPLDLEEIFNQLPFIKTVFYTSNTGNNIHLARLSALNHIFIGHGDSEKAASAHKALRLYDEIWTAGQAHIDRFKNAKFNLGHLKFVKVGRPNLKNSLALASQNWLERLPLTFLYLPTWEGFIEEHNYSSLHLAPHFLQKIQSSFNCQILAKFHPLVGSRNQAFKNIEDHFKNLQSGKLDIEVIDRLTPVDSLVSKANIFICDISAVVTECLAADAPIFIYIPQDKHIDISQSNMLYREYCYTFSSIPELMEKMQNLLESYDELADARAKACEYFIGKKETLSDEFIKNLQILGGKSSLEANPRIYAVL